MNARTVVASSSHQFVLPSKLWNIIMNDIKILPDNPNARDFVCSAYERKFTTHIDALNSNSPRFFITIDSQEKFNNYQKYYFLLTFIEWFAKLDTQNIAKNLIANDWATERYTEEVVSLLKDPAPNTLYNVDYVATYNRLIAPRQVKYIEPEEKVRTLPYHKAGFSFIEVSSRYINIIAHEGMHTIFDFSQMHDENIEEMFKRNRIASLHRLSLSKSTYGELLNYDKLYIVFSPIHIDAQSKTSLFSSRGSLTFVGKFVENGANIDFVPFYNSIKYNVDKASPTVKRLTFYITTEGNKVITFDNTNTNFTTKMLYNAQVLNTAIKSKNEITRVIDPELSATYLASRDVIVRVSEVSGTMDDLLAQQTSPVIQHGYDYVAAFAHNDTTIRVKFNSNNDNATFNLIDDSDNVVSITTIKGDAGIIAREKFDRITPNYYIQNDDIAPNSLIHQSFATHLGWRAAYKYEKAVCFADLGKTQSRVAFSYIATLCDIYPHVCYVNLGNGWWKVIDPNIAPSHLDTYVKVFECSVSQTNFEVNEQYVKAPSGEIAYVGYDKPFSFDTRNWYVLRKDGFVYTHNIAHVETFYIDNHENCFRVECAAVDNVPSFTAGEEVPYLTPTDVDITRIEQSDLSTQCERLSTQCERLSTQCEPKYECLISNVERRPYVQTLNKQSGAGNILIDNKPYPFEYDGTRAVIQSDVGVVESTNDIRVSTDIELILRLE